MIFSRKKAKYILWILLLLLAVFNATVWWVMLDHDSRELTVSFLDVGQGDAILIKGPTGTDVLVDGGRDRAVLRRLSEELGPLDRTLDLVVETHPDADHIGGLPEVFARYKVSGYLTPGIENDTAITYALSDAVHEELGITRMLARRGMRIHIGADAYLDVLFPDRDVTHVETNTGSVILRLVYGEVEFMLTGDAPVAIEDWIAAGAPVGTLSSDVLKAGHHGSRTSTSEGWLLAVSPEYVVISAGKDNSYGHPHEEVLARIREYAGRQSSERPVHVLSTAEEGTITFVTDGHILTAR